MSGTTVNALRFAGKSRAGSTRGEAVTALRVCPPASHSDGASFTFRQLARWRDLASEGMLGRHPLLVYVDMDEARNRVTLGILQDREGNERDDLRRRLEELGIPTAAMHFEHTTPIEPLAGASGPPSSSRAAATTATFLDSYATLRDNGSPFIGGLEIQSPTCTATLAVDYNGSRHLAMASHCTDIIYEVDGHEVFQHDGVSRIGVETQDPLFTLFNGARSRYSDAALALIDAGVQTRRGAIARPTGRNGGGWSGGSGPLTINPSRSFLTVTQVEQGQVMYAEVQKVGRTTGWTYGIIGATCVDDLSADGAWRRCSTHANFFAQPGDSGSPVFRWFGGDGVTLMGILWGISASYSTYSGYQSFARELGGTLNPITDINVTTPSVSGIVNPSNLRPEMSFSSTTNSPYATEYRVERQRCQPAGLTSWVQVYQGTNTTFIDYEVTASETLSSGYPSCGFSGMYWAAYRVTAINMGVYSPGTGEITFGAYQ